MESKPTLYAQLKRVSVRISGTWLLEIAAAVVSTGCLLTLLLVLWVASGKEIMVWHGFTLNTITAILATASKMSALYVISSALGQTKWNTFRQGPRSLADFEAIDRASRGILGCAQLLWHTRKM